MRGDQVTKDKEQKAGGEIRNQTEVTIKALNPLLYIVLLV